MKAQFVGGIAVCLLAMACDAAPPGVLYDLGPADGRTWSGAQAVAEQGAPAGFVWLGDGDREAVRRLQPDPLSEDFVRGRSEAPLRFVLRLPAGAQRVSLLLGDTGADEQRLPRFYQQPVVVRIGEHEQVIDPAPDWPFRLLSLPDVGGPSFWERHFAARFRWVEAVAAGGGTVRVEIAPGWAAPLCGVHVAPVAAEVAGWRRTLQQERLAYFAAHGWQPSAAESAPGPGTAAGGAEPLPYTLHTHHWMEEVLPTTPPPAGARPLDLRVIAAPGEVEPVTFSITPHRGLAKIAITVSDLVGGGGQVLPAGAVRVGWARYQDRPERRGVGLRQVRRYRRVPHAILPLDHWQPPLLAGVTRQFWLSVAVPRNQPPGRYVGDVTLRVPEAPEATLPLTVEVRPVAIGPLPGEAHFFYFSGPGAYDRILHPGPRGATYEAAFLRDSRVMAEAGFSMAELVVPPRALREAADGSLTADLSAVERELRLWRRAGMVPPDGRTSLVLLNLVERFGGHWNQIQGGPGSHVLFTRRPAEQQRFREFVRWLGEAARHRPGWPALVFECGGELTNYRQDNEGAAWGETVYRLLREAGVRTALRGNGEVDQAVMEQGSVDVAILNYWLIRTDTIQRLRQKGVEIWLYNFGTDRFNFGLLAWVVGASRTGHEGFQVAVGEPFNDWDGLIRDWGTALPTPYGPVPTVALIAMREGIDDYRYLRTLERRVEELEGMGVVDSAIPEARRFLEQVRGGVAIDLPVQRGDRKAAGPTYFSWWDLHQQQGWTPARLDGIRDEAATWIERLTSLPRP